MRIPFKWCIVLINCPLWGSEFDMAIAEMLGGFIKQIESLDPLVIFRTKKLMIILSLHYNLCLYLKAWAVKTLSSSIRIFSRKLEVCFLSDCDSLIQIFRFSGIRKIGMVDTVKEKGPRKRFVLFYYVFLFLKNCLLILNVKKLYIKRQSVIYLFTNYKNY